MDREGAPPDRCVVCKAAWRLFCWVAPLALLVAGSTLRIPMLLLAFWPTVIVLGIANYLVRKKVKLDLRACERHRRLPNLLQALSIATLLAAVLVFSRLWAGESSITFPAPVIVCAVVLAFAQRMLGRSFRETLPEAPGR